MKVMKGTIQDATFIESDPGRGKSQSGDGTIKIDPEFPEITSMKKKWKCKKRFEDSEEDREGT